MLNIGVIVASLCAGLGVSLGWASLGWAQSPSQSPSSQVLPVDRPSRSHILLYTSSLERAFSEAVTERLKTKAGVAINIKTVLANTAFRDFCAGVSLDAPDVIAVPRRMSEREFINCNENGVIDVLELKIGYDALVFMTKKGDPIFNLTPKQTFMALAAEIPKGGKFVPNQAKRWRDIDVALPDQDIRVYMPQTGTVINTFFKDIFMEGGCRGLKQFKEYYMAIDRVRQCTTLRRDDRVVEIRPPIAVNFKEAAEKAPPGSLIVVPYVTWLNNRHQYDLLPIMGVLPSHDSITSDEYEAVYPVLYYVKRGSMEKRFGGKNIAPGLYSFIQEIMSEDAKAHGGYLAQRGLVVEDEDQRIINREKALRLERFKR
ncbi:phosphate transport system substrate-binding protein [Azospirillaceae bacterium]